MKQEERRKGNSFSPLRMLFIIALSVFLAETSLMFLLDAFPPLPSVFSSLLDATLLTLTISPMLYFFLYRPLSRTSELKCLVENLNIEIGHRRQVEEALKGTKEQYQFLVNNINIGIALIDNHYKVVTANHFHSRMFRKPEGEFVGKYCFMEFEKREKICPHCPGTKAMATGKIEEVDTEGVLDDGSRISVHINAFPVFGPDGRVTGFIEVVEDITGRKKAEETQTRLIEESKKAGNNLEKANADLKEKMEVLQKFQQLTINREERIIQLKKRVQELEGKREHE